MIHVQFEVICRFLKFYGMKRSLSSLFMQARGLRWLTTYCFNKIQKIMRNRNKGSVLERLFGCTLQAANGCFVDQVFAQGESRSVLVPQATVDRFSEAMHFASLFASFRDAALR